MERIIELNDPVLRKLVEQKMALAKEGAALNDEAEELRKKHEKVVQKMQQKANQIDRLKLYKIIPRTKKVADDLLGEFEVATTTEIKDGKLILKVNDLMEEFKTSFKTFDKWKEPAPKKEKKQK